MEAAVASQLQSRIGSGLTVTNPSGSMLRIMDDGAAGTADMISLQAEKTADGSLGALQNGDPALALFVDYNDTPFTNSLDGEGQKLGLCRPHPRQRRHHCRQPAGGEVLRSDAAWGFNAAQPDRREPRQPALCR